MPNQKICFVIMPFGELGSADAAHFSYVYEKLSCPVAKKCGYDPVRVDKKPNTRNILFHVFNYLFKAQVVIADLSRHRANVFYELRIRHALKKSGTILIRDLAETMPFDVYSLDAIGYSVGNNEREFKKMLRAGLPI